MKPYRKMTVDERRAYHRAWEENNKARRAASPSRSREARLEANRKWIAKNRHRHKGYMLKYRYGLSREQYEQMRITQEHRCAICTEPILTEKTIHVDHSHQAGSVRALLCKRCNLGIGYFDENPALMAKAFMYLTKHTRIGEVA